MLLDKMTVRVLNDGTVPMDGKTNLVDEAERLLDRIEEVIASVSDRAEGQWRVAGLEITVER